VQVLEFAAYLRIFKNDQRWPTRLRSSSRDGLACAFRFSDGSANEGRLQGSQSVALNRERPDAVGDFVLTVGGTNTHVNVRDSGTHQKSTSPYLVRAHYKEDRRCDRSDSHPLIFKIRSTSACAGKPTPHTQVAPQVLGRYQTVSASDDPLEGAQSSAVGIDPTFRTDAV